MIGNAISTLPSITVGASLIVTAQFGATQLVTLSLEKQSTYIIELTEVTLTLVPSDNYVLLLLSTAGTILGESVFRVGVQSGSVIQYASLGSRVIYTTTHAEEVICSYRYLSSEEKAGSFVLKVKEQSVLDLRGNGASGVMAGTIPLRGGASQEVFVEKDKGYVIDIITSSFNPIVYFTTQESPAFASNYDPQFFIDYALGLGSIIVNQSNTMPGITYDTQISFIAEETQQVTVGIDSLFDLESGSFALNLSQRNNVPTAAPTNISDEVAFADPNDVFGTCGFDVVKLTVNGECEDGVALFCREEFLPRVLLGGRVDNELVEVTTIEEVCDCVSLLCGELQGDGISQKLRDFEIFIFICVAMVCCIVLIVSAFTVFDMVYYQELRVANERVLTWGYCVLYFGCTLGSMILEVQLLLFLDTIKEASGRFERVQKETTRTVVDFYIFTVETGSRDYYLNEESQDAISSISYSAVVGSIVANNTLIAIATILSELCFLEISLVWIQVSYAQKQLDRQQNPWLVRFKHLIRCIEISLMLFLTYFTAQLLLSSAK